MADPAHQETERIIKRIEQRINREYAQAMKEVQEKLDDYMRRFYKKDETWQKYVNEVKKSDPREYKKRLSDYKKWRESQIAVGKRWGELKQTIAEDMANTNEIARNVAKGYMPEVYAVNHDYGTYTVESQSGKDTNYSLMDGKTALYNLSGSNIGAGISFSLYDHSTIERLIRDNPEILPLPGRAVSEQIARGKAVKWNKQKVQSVMLQAILQGESIPKIATRLAETVGDSNRKAAIRNARTLATGVQNAGRVDSYRRAEEMGIKMKQQWLAVHDGRTRHSHRMIDYEIRPVGERFSNGCEYPGDPSADAGEIYNCFIGETLAYADSDILRSYKREYIGDLYTVETAGGVKFTCTPNHPILTDRGWVKAGLLNKGDHLIVTTLGDDLLLGGNPDVNHALTRMDAIHKFFDEVGGERVSTLSVDFHGDIPTSDVEIIAKKGLLRVDGDPGTPKGGDEFLFKDADPLTPGKGHQAKGLRAVWLSALRIVRGLCEKVPFFRGSVSHSNVHRLGAVSGGNTDPNEGVVDSCAATSVDFGEFFNRIPGHKSLDNVVSIQIQSCITHVFNLQTVNGFYFVNTLANDEGKSNGKVAVAHNCRCTLRGLVDGLEPQARKYMDQMVEDGDGKMVSYEEWRNSKKTRSNRITLPEEKAKAIRGSYIHKYRQMSR